MQRAQLRDVSLGGVGLQTQEAVRRGEPVQVMLTLDGQSWLALAGLVRHVRRDGEGYVVGLDIGASDPLALDRFRHFVASAKAAIRPPGKTSTGPYPAVSGNNAPARTAPPAAKPVRPPSRSAARPGATPRKAAKPGAEPEVKAQPSEPGKRPRPQTLVDRDLAALYRAAMQDVAGPPKKPKKR